MQLYVSLCFASIKMEGNMMIFSFPFVTFWRNKHTIIGKKSICWIYSTQVSRQCFSWFKSPQNVFGFIVTLKQGNIFPGWAKRVHSGQTRWANLCKDRKLLLRLLLLLLLCVRIGYITHMRKTVKFQESYQKEKEKRGKIWKFKSAFSSILNARPWTYFPWFN